MPRTCASHCSGGRLPTVGSRPPTPTGGWFLFWWQLPWGGRQYLRTPVGLETPDAVTAFWLTCRLFPQGVYISTKGGKRNLTKGQRTGSLEDFTFSLFFFFFFSFCFQVMLLCLLLDDRTFLTGTNVDCKMTPRGCYPALTPSPIHPTQGILKLMLWVTCIC